jgi:Fe-S cluster assembly protein SufD
MNLPVKEADTTEWLIGGDAERSLVGLPGSARLTAVRRAALNRFRAAGLPTRRDEAWKYTDLAAAIRAPSRLAAHPGAVPAPSLDGTIRVGMLNGFIVALDAQGCPPGVSLQRLSDGFDGEALGAALDDADKPLVALNTALFADALLVKVADGVVVERPIEIVSLGQGDEAPTEFHPRCLIALGRGSSATIVERHLGSGRYVANGVVEIALAEHATLRHYKLQLDSADAVHVAATGVLLGAGASYEGAILQLGGSLARSEMHAALDGPAASFTLEGAVLAGGRQHIDNTTRVVHRAAGGRSRQVFRSVLDDKSRGVFQGTVLVERNAQKTDAHQLSQALLLAQGAEMDAKPALEIFADDVKCGHGASIGALDETALFYLRSRGVGVAEARRLLIEGFLAEVIDRIASEPARAAFAAAVDERLCAVRPKEE